MAILTGFLALVGAILFFLWRLHMASEAAKGLLETSDDLRSYLRKRNWQKKVKSNRLDLVDDPRIAATAMMVAVAQADGALTAREEAEIVNQAVTHFEIDAPLAEELLAHARWIVGNADDLENCFHRLTPLLRRTLDPKQREDLFEMLTAIASIAPDDDAGEAGRALASLRNRLS